MKLQWLRQKVAKAILFFLRDTRIELTEKEKEYVKRNTLETLRQEFVHNRNMSHFFFMSLEEMIFRFHIDEHNPKILRSRDTFTIVNFFQQMNVPKPCVMRAIDNLKIHGYIETNLASDPQAYFTTSKIAKPTEFYTSLGDIRDLFEGFFPKKPSNLNK